MDGLATGYFCLSLFFLVNIIPASSFDEIEGIVFPVLQATSAFFCFNFLFSRVLLGDMGAYLLGYLLFVILFLISAKVEFELLLLACFVFFYPFYEVSRTIVRRLLTRVGITNPDRLHLHSVLFEGFRKTGINATMSNKLTTITLLCLFGAHLIVIYEFRNYSFTLFMVTVSAIVMYECLYHLVFNFIKSVKDI